MYYLTVTRDDQDLIRRKEFHDYSKAMAFLSAYCQPRWPRSVLRFSTEFIGGEFARTYVSLAVPDEVDAELAFYEERLHRAKKQHNAYRYDHSYLFLVESPHGIADADALDNDDYDYD